jgi:hypothetical protein
VKLDLDIATVVQLLTALTAVLAVTIAPIVSLRISSRQIASARELASKQIGGAWDAVELQVRSAVLSKNRQAWINSLRDEISRFVASAHKLRSIPRVIEVDSRAQQLIDVMENLYISKIKITLLINPLEPDHEELVCLISQIYEALKQPDVDVMTIEANLVAKAQAVLKREWKQVKLVQ